MFSLRMKFWYIANSEWNAWMDDAVTLTWIEDIKSKSCNNYKILEEREILRKYILFNFSLQLQKDSNIPKV